MLILIFCWLFHCNRGAVHLVQIHRSLGALPKCLHEGAVSLAHHKYT